MVVCSSLFGFVVKTFLAPGPKEGPSTEPKMVHSANGGTGKGDRSAQSEVNNALILESNIFGKGLSADHGVRKTQVDSDRGGKQAADRLGLKLLGTVAGDRAVSFAVLEDSQTGLQDIYQVGDTIREALLEEILPNRIVVLFQGERCTLDVAANEGRAMSSRPAMARVSKPPVPVPAQGQMRDILRRISSSESLLNTVASANSVRQLRRGLRGLTLKPNRDGPEGLKVTGVSKSPVAHLVGLREGDVIRAINGHSVANLSKAAQVLRKARKVGQAEIRLTRDEKERTLSLRLGVW